MVTRDKHKVRGRQQGAIQITHFVLSLVRGSTSICSISSQEAIKVLRVEKGSAGAANTEQVNDQKEKMYGSKGSISIKYESEGNSISSLLSCLAVRTWNPT